MQDLSPRDVLVATDMANGIARIVTLDRIWTEEAQLASVPETRDPGRIADLQPIVADMETVLRQCADLAPQLAELGTRIGGSWPSRLEAVETDGRTRGASGERIANVYRSVRLHVVEHDDGDASKYLTGATERMTALIDDEITALKAEYKALTAGASSDGDISDDLADAMGAVALGTAIVAPELLPVVIVVESIIGAVADCLGL